MKITIIGSGNVATYFAIAFKAKKYNIVQVYSPNESHAKQLADSVEATACSSPEKINPDSDFYLIAISDDALKSFAEKFKVKDKI
ncbi:MAG: NAD(P)-binding domain-containing protein, partial [Bacteroidia bacterium]|nr:NAD(P)-binding domain-containing protein [Bacteroidia bacterium]